MSIPVIIPARNEAEHIGIALDSLSRQAHEVDPIVIINDSTDRTADIALATGATVLESKRGKIPAIQEGLRHLGKRALGPMLILDADCRPVSKQWSSRMSNELSDLPNEDPAIIWGPYVFKGEINPALGAFFTATSMQVSWADRHKDKPRTIRGGNIGLHMKKDELLEAMLVLGNYWPRDDVAVFDRMKEHDASHKLVTSPQGWVFTSGSRTMDTVRRIIRDRKHPSEAMDDSYASDAPSDSTPYFSETTDTVHHLKPES